MLDEGRIAYANVRKVIFLLISTGAAELVLLTLALLVPIGAMPTPWISDLLRIPPVSPTHWLELVGTALLVLPAMEIHKAIRA